MIVAFIISITGDRFESPDNNLIAIVLDLFNGRSFNLAVSFIGDATNLGVLNVFIAFNLTSSNP